MFRSVIALVLSVAVTTPALARPDAAERIEIAMSSFKYSPANITLRHGQSYVLHFVNQSDGGHNFVAKRFFEAAQITSGDRKSVLNGEVALKGGETEDIHLIAPAIGRYEAHCSHFMHSTFGMKAEVVVI